MQLTSIFLLAIGMHINAAGISQKISFKGENVSLEKVFSSIKLQTDYGVFCDYELLVNASLVTLEARNKPLKDFLNEVLIARQLNYRIKGKNIFISMARSPAPTQKPPSAADTLEKVSGRITDENSKPIAGVTIQVSNSKMGTQSDEKGEFSLSVPPRSTLIFTYQGYGKKEVKIAGSPVVNVQLEPSVQALSQVVVVGYGTLQKKNVSTSVVSLGAKQIQDLPVGNVAQAMAAQMSGVVVQQTQGTPGASVKIRIRGTGSINSSNAPLYVVDGYPLPDASSFNAIDPNDVLSVDVLKDAAAAAVYGSRGGNGVIIVTTKKGKAGKTRFDLNSYAGIQEVSKKVDVLNPAEFVDYARDAFIAGGRPLAPIFDKPEKWANTDWQDVIFRKAAMSNYQLTASGGSENIRFLISGTYFKQAGILKGTDYDRLSLRVNMDANLSKKLKMGINLVPSYITSDNQVSSGLFNEGSTSGPTLPASITTALILPPIIPERFENGDYGQLSNETIAEHPDYNNLIFNTYSPVAPLDLYKDKTETFRMLGNIYAEFEILKGLTFKTSAGAELVNDTRNMYKPATIANVPFPNVTLSKPNLSSIDARQVFAKNYNWLTENTLNYSATLAGDHKFNVLAGYTAQKNLSEGNYLYSFIDKGVAPFSNDGVQYISNASDIRARPPAKSQWALTSTIARINYSFRDKYLLLASVRHDRSSKFGPERRSHTFPAFSAAWRISNEKFMEGLTAKSVLSDLKLRVSYGESGNFNILGGDYPWSASLGRADYSFGAGTGQRQVAYALGGFSNPAFTWETNRQTDIGLEAGLFNDRIYITADVYQRNTNDLVLNRQLPGVVGFASNVNLNVGSMQNKGVELGITSTNITGRFTWTTNLNFSLNRNKITSLGGIQEISVGAVVGGWSSASSRMTVGRPIGDYYGYIADGVYLNQADLAASPNFGLGSKPGDAKYRDINKDGKITTADITLIGNGQPDFTAGITNTFRYKGFELNAIVQGVKGGSIVNGTERYQTQAYGWINATGAYRNRWRSEASPGDGKTPRSAYGAAQNFDFSSRHLYSGSFLRIRNVTLAYTVPAAVSQKIKIENIRIYISGQNLVTFSNYSGYNPEANNYGDEAARASVDQGAYPLPRIFTAGLNVGF